MDENLARRAHTLLMRAVQLEPAERREFVASSCHGDPELQRRVGQLLQALDGSDDFLETTAWNGSRTRLPDQPLQAEQVIGNYRVVRAIGVGGMATVYEAIQAQPHRRVALKVPRHGWEHTDAIQRFEYETEVLGRLQHPGIAQIYEAGTWDAGNGVSAPFFAMEFVPDALNITDYARTEHLDLRDRLSMFASVCEAVHYGHQKGVIHRDLKPPNILVNAQGQAKVIDFGLARNSDPNASWITQATDVGQLIGTLNYMSPEQSCLGTSLDVRSDVYSLGVVLYQLICNRLPHDLSGIPVPEALRIVQQDPPKRPASVDASLRGDLDAVVLKAIDKDPERRYRSVDALGADIRRFLNRQTVEARPPTVIYQCRMFARRNRALVGSIATVFLAVVLGSILSARYAYRAQMAEAAAIGERDAAIWNAYIANIAAGVSAYEAGEFGRMRATLNAVPDQMKGWEWGLLQRLARTSAATIAAHDDMIMAFDVSSAAGRMVSGSHDGFISVWDAHSHERVSSTKHHRGRVRAVTISHDGQYVVGAYEGNKIVVADAETGGLLYTIPNMRTTEFSVHIDENGILAIIDGDGAIRFIELANNREVGRLPSVPETSRHGLAPGTSSDELLVWGESGVLSVIQRETGAVRISCNHEAPLRVATTSDDGKLIATGGQGIRVWSADDGALLREFGDQSTQARTLDFSPDGKFLASGKSDRLIKFWSLDSDSNEPAVVWHGHEETVSGVRFGGDGANVYSASWDRTIRVWDLDDVDPITTLDGHEDYVIGCAFDPSGSILATSSRDRTIRLWEPATGRIIVSLPGHRDSVYGLAFSHDGRQLASASHDDTVRLWNTETGVCESELEGHRDNVWAVAYDPSRKQLASGGNDQTIRIWALDQRVTLRELKGHDNRVISLAYSPDGKRLASSSRDHSVRLWDPSTGEHLRTFEGHESDVFAVLFSPDGRRLYSGSRDQTVRLWNIETGECEHIFAGHGQFVTSLALSPDGTRLAAGSWFRDIILWDVATRDLVAAFKAHDLAIRSIAFSSDGRKLVSASMDKTARIWDITPRPQRLAERQAARTATAAAETLIAEAVDELTAALDGCDPTPQQIADKIRSDERVTDKLRPWAWKALLRRADELGM